MAAQANDRRRKLPPPPPPPPPLPCERNSNPEKSSNFEYLRPFHLNTGTRDLGLAQMPQMGTASRNVKLARPPRVSQTNVKLWSVTYQEGQSSDNDISFNPSSIQSTTKIYFQRSNESSDFEPTLTQRLLLCFLLRRR